ncbi:DUF2914 domain-containing protein [Sorangium sp. So ce315]|uniref:DUF2914 domain-containing protein n=1 Tax=Sorangium sp. So ce315 TaxID=3133299 RepID=UPI003F5DD74A
MATTIARRMMALALCTVALAGCGEPHDARPPAPAAVASPPPAPCSEPAAAAAPAPPPAATAIAAAPAVPAGHAAAGAGSAAAGAGSAAAGAGSKEASEKAGEGKAELKVKRLVVAGGVKDREPVEPRTTFRAQETERIYAFVELEHRGDAEGEVTVAFVPPDGGAPVGNVRLAVGASPRWRTWAFTRGARKPGEWTAIVQSDTGEVLARTPFEMTL